MTGNFIFRQDTADNPSSHRSPRGHPRAWQYMDKGIIPSLARQGKLTECRWWGSTGVPLLNLESGPGNNCLWSLGRQLLPGPYCRHGGWLAVPSVPDVTEDGCRFSSWVTTRCVRRWAINGSLLSGMYSPSLQTKHVHLLGDFKKLSTKTMFNLPRMTYFGKFGRTFVRALSFILNIFLLCNVLYSFLRTDNKELPLLTLSVLLDEACALRCFSKKHRDWPGFVKQ